jgi:hypothetical protein
MIRPSQYKSLSPLIASDTGEVSQGRSAQGMGKGWWKFVARVRGDILAGLYRDGQGRTLVLADPADIEARLKARQKEEG